MPTLSMEFCDVQCSGKFIRRCDLGNHRQEKRVLDAALLMIPGVGQIAFQRGSIPPVHRAENVQNSPWVD